MTPARTGKEVKRADKPKPSARAKSGNEAAERNLTTLTDRQATSGRAVLVHGDQSAGKTCLAILKAPKPLLVLDVDNGLDSVIGMVGSDKVQIWQPSDGIEYTYSDLDEYRNYVMSGDWDMPYKTIVTDNVTAAQKPFIRYAIDEAMNRMAPEKRAARDPDIPTQQDWGKIYRMMDTWVRNIRDVKRRGVHCIFTSGTREWMDDDQGILRIMPDIEGRERNQITTHMDAVGYLEIEDDERVLHLGPTGAVITKIRLPVNRHNNVPDSIIDPDFIKMMKVVEIVSKEAEKKASTTSTKKKKATKK